MHYNLYGEIAIRALEFLKICECADDAWDNAAIEISGKESIMKKSCPKNAFLGIVAGKPSKNALYAYSYGCRNGVLISLSWFIRNSQINVADV